MPDWRNADAYRPLAAMERRAFAWEWLRRNRRYCETWQNVGERRGEDPMIARRFGLVVLEDPALPAGVARPIWIAEIDNAVVVADILPDQPAPGEGIDLLDIAPFVTLAVDPENHEHLLLSDGVASVRLDIVRGTLLGGRMHLAYRLSGVGKLRAPLMTLRRLVTLIITGAISRKLIRTEKMAERWILELRVADALATGASHQDIARTLFGPLVPDHRWRREGEAVRLRVQRLARKVDERLRDGAHFQWFKH